MKTVTVKQLIVYKNHIFPAAHKPLRSITQYLSLKNPDLNELKVRKMKQILNDQEKRRIVKQKSALNQQINVSLQKYYLKYIQPFQKCPDYYCMLFRYANKKLQWISQNKNIIKGEQFFLAKKQVKAILKKLNQEDEQKTITSASNDENILKDRPILQKNKQLKDRQQLEKSKLLFDIYRQLYPSQKAQVYLLFTRLYKKFLKNERTVSQQLLQTNIAHLKPLLYISPIQLYQSKKPEYCLKQCQDYLIEHQNERQNVCLQFANKIRQRQQQINFIAQKFKVFSSDIRRAIWGQYVDSQKQQSFYSLLKGKQY